MRAIVQDQYGGTEQLRLADLPDPTPGEGEVLVRVGAAAVDRGTWHVMTGTPLLARLGLGLRAPGPRYRTPGRDFAGTVEAVGPGVPGWAVGDPVHGTADGSLAELVVTSTTRISTSADWPPGRVTVIIAVSSDTMGRPRGTWSSSSSGWPKIWAAAGLA